MKIVKYFLQHVQSTTISLLYRIFQILTIENKNKFWLLSNKRLLSILERFTFVFIGFIEPNMSIPPFENNLESYFIFVLVYLME